jgi:Sulfite exporter TauE/SafE
MAKLEDREISKVAL